MKPRDLREFGILRRASRPHVEPPNQFLHAEYLLGRLSFLGGWLETTSSHSELRTRCDFWISCPEADGRKQSHGSDHLDRCHGLRTPATLAARHGQLEDGCRNVRVTPNAGWFRFRLLAEVPRRKKTVGTIAPHLSGGSRKEPSESLTRY